MLISLPHMAGKAITYLGEIMETLELGTNEKGRLSKAKLAHSTILLAPINTCPLLTMA